MQALVKTFEISPEDQYNCSRIDNIDGEKLEENNLWYNNFYVRCNSVLQSDHYKTVINPNTQQ